LFFLTVIVIALLAFFGPEEQSLGANVRVVYLHGAWVLTAEIAFFAAAIAGGIALLTRREVFHHWSAALGRAGIFFWLTYLPLSLWATPVGSLLLRTFSSLLFCVLCFRLLKM
jgi:hypothetical protein